MICKWRNKWTITLLGHTFYAGKECTRFYQVTKDPIKYIENPALEHRQNSYNPLYYYQIADNLSVLSQAHWILFLIWLASYIRLVCFFLKRGGQIMHIWDSHISQILAFMIILKIFSEFDLLNYYGKNPKWIIILYNRSNEFPW